MAKFSGNIGYALSVETAQGVYTDVISVRAYVGDVIREQKQWQPSNEKVNDDLTVSNRLSIVADDFALSNFALMKYVEWGGNRWKISSVEIQRPRLILSVGGLYNGPTP